ncbi:hypothetical protein COY23_03815 [bacterium (Candidatus Torokbacteria) CG_4_10_14_0_2_um_filter_35_8]|nr:MAG: hypothetical protein COY23_03815 [bacterium (Candidatus Torokbacteria) CG_4_10_14_0_2_um_filter_35_8]
MQSKPAMLKKGVIVFLLLTLTVPNLVAAYELQVPLLGTTEVSTFADYVKLIFNVVLVLAGLTAVIMIIYGGYRYMTAAGSAQAMENAKEVIAGALLGLVLVVGTFVILSTISPNLIMLPFLSTEGGPIIEPTETATVLNIKSKESVYNNDSDNFLVLASSDSNQKNSSVELTTVTVSPTLSINVAKATDDIAPGEIYVETSTPCQVEIYKDGGFHAAQGTGNDKKVIFTNLPAGKYTFLAYYYIDPNLPAGEGKGQRNHPDNIVKTWGGVYVEIKPGTGKDEPSEPVAPTPTQTGFSVTAQKTGNNAIKVCAYYDGKPFKKEVRTSVYKSSSEGGKYEIYGGEKGTGPTEGCYTFSNLPESYYKVFGWTNIAGVGQVKDWAGVTIHITAQEIPDIPPSTGFLKITPIPTSNNDGTWSVKFKASKDTSGMGAQGVSCNTSSDCTSGYECKNGKCVKKSECVSDSDCPSGKECKNGQCVKKSTTRTCTGDNEVFSESANKCVCKTGYVRSDTTGKCVKESTLTKCSPPCSSDEICAREWMFNDYRYFCVKKEVADKERKEAKEEVEKEIERKIRKSHVWINWGKGVYVKIDENGNLKINLDFSTVDVDVKIVGKEVLEEAVRVGKEGLTSDIARKYIIPYLPTPVRMVLEILISITCKREACPAYESISLDSSPDSTNNNRWIYNSDSGACEYHYSTIVVLPQPPITEIDRSYYWDFGDGGTAWAGSQITRNYYPGKYTVTAKKDELQGQITFTLPEIGVTAVSTYTIDENTHPIDVVVKEVTTPEVASRSIFDIFDKAKAYYDYTNTSFKEIGRGQFHFSAKGAGSSSIQVKDALGVQIRSKFERKIGGNGGTLTIFLDRSSLKKNRTPKVVINNNNVDFKKVSWDSEVNLSVSGDYNYEPNEVYVEISASNNRCSQQGRTIQFKPIIKDVNAQYTYEWDFDDGNKSNEKEPKHSYGSKISSGIKKFKVTLTVKDNQGKTGTAQYNLILAPYKITCR